MTSMGDRIRSARKAKGWTLSQLSELTSLSISFLSQIERGACAPSIASLHTICDQIGISVPEALGFPDKNGDARSESEPVIRAGQALLIHLAGSPVGYEYLSGAFPGRLMEILLNRFPAGYKSPLSPHKREEFGFVLSGHISIRIGDRQYDLEPKDTYHFPASIPHSYATRAEEGAEVLVVSTERFLEWGRVFAGAPNQTEGEE